MTTSTRTRTGIRAKISALGTWTSASPSHQRRPGKNGRHLRRVDHVPRRHQRAAHCRTGHGHQPHGGRGGAAKPWPSAASRRTKSKSSSSARSRRTCSFPPPPAWCRTTWARRAPGDSTSPPPVPGLSTPADGAQVRASGAQKKVLVIGADTMSSIIDYTDRATCVLFGDGAGAVLLEPASRRRVGLIDFIMKSMAPAPALSSCRAGAACIRRRTKRSTRRCITSIRTAGRFTNSPCAKWSKPA